jgi:glycosyltransferase involved in cell wall biosynthesis
MDVVFVCESATVSGGAEKTTIQEALELRRRGLRVGYISGGREADQALVEAGVELLFLDTVSFFEETNRSIKIKKLLWNPSIEPQVQVFLAKFSVDQTVVHLVTFRLKLSGIVGHIAQELGFATVIHCHDYSPICPTSLYYNHRAKKNCDRKPMSLSCITCECQGQPWRYKLPKLTSHFWNQSVWKLNERSQGLLHISQLEQQTIDANVSSKIPGFMMTPIGEPAPNSRVLAESNENVLFIGRLTEEKGLMTFLTCATAAAVKAVVIGDGPQYSDAKMQFPEARFTGWIARDQIDLELKLARSLVVPSVWRETLCLSVIDAMGMGIPCIVSENVGAKQFIRNGENGVIYAEGQLEQAIERLSDYGFVQKMSEQAYADFQSAPATIENHVTELIRVYEQCLAGNTKQ